jgi:MFS family permease
VVSAYVLFFAGFLLLAGRVADLWGRRRTFVAGLAVVHGGFAVLRALGLP